MWYIVTLILILAGACFIYATTLNKTGNIGFSLLGLVLLGLVVLVLGIYYWARWVN